MIERLKKVRVAQPLKESWANLFRVFVASLGLESGVFTFFYSQHDLATGIACWLLIGAFALLVAALWPTKRSGQLTRKLVNTNMILASDVLIFGAFLSLIFPILALPLVAATWAAIIEQAIFVVFYGIDIVHVNRYRKSLEKQLDDLLQFEAEAKQKKV